MTEKLKEYLKLEINNKILENVRGKNERELELFFNSIYYFVNLLEKDSQVPAIALKTASEQLTKIKDEEEKRIFIKAVLLILNQEKYSTWQFKEIHSELKKSSNVLENSKFIKFLGTNFKPAIEVLKEIEERDAKARTENEKKIDIFIKKARQKAVLFTFLQNDETSSIITNLIFNTLYKWGYIKCTFQQFERHFVQTDEPFVKINWYKKKTELKAFVDLLFNRYMIYHLNEVNIQIEQHFVGSRFTTESNSFSNTTSQKPYKEIVYYKTPSHPISILFEEIKNLLKENS